MFHWVLSYRGLRVLVDLFMKVLDSLGNEVSSILRLESVSVVKHLLLYPYLQRYAYLSRMVLNATSFVPTYLTYMNLKFIKTPEL